MRGIPTLQLFLSSSLQLIPCSLLLFCSLNLSSYSARIGESPHGCLSLRYGSGALNQ